MSRAAARVLARDIGRVMTRAMTYDEIASAFGITRDSARRLVQRKRWLRRKGNDGTARIDVPLDALPSPPVPGALPGHDMVASPGDSPPHDKGAGRGAIEALSRVIERLEAEIVELRPKAAERDVLATQVEALRSALKAANADRERLADRDALAAQVEALRAILEAEKARAEEARADRDRWALQAHALAHPPVPPAPISMPSRGLLGWFRAAR